VTGHQADIDLQTVKADEAAVSVAQANVASQERLLRVLRQNRSYASVVAPFDGVITQRNVDVGSLGRRAEARELFDRLLLRCNDAGLLVQEFDPLIGRMVGHFSSL
jgi:hypothetical protein